MSKFYTNFYRRGNNVFVRGYENGKRFQDKIWYEPSLFVSTNKETDYTNIQGEAVDEVVQNSMGDARKFFQKYEGVNGFDICVFSVFVSGNKKGWFVPDLILEPFTILITSNKNVVTSAVKVCIKFIHYLYYIIILPKSKVLTVHTFDVILNACPLHVNNLIQLC